MRHTTRLLAAGAVATTVLLASAGTAMAGSDSIDDKRYDSLVTHNVPNTGGTLASKGTYAQRVQGGKIDVDKMTVNHGHEFVSIRLNFHNLGQSTQVVGDVRVNGGTANDFTLLIIPTEGGEAYVEMFPGEGSSTICNSTFDTNRIRATSKVGAGGFLQLYVPRACFDNPRYVRLGAASTYYGDLMFDTSAGRSLAKSIEKANADQDVHYYDPINSAYFGAPEFTSWLARG